MNTASDAVLRETFLDIDGMMCGSCAAAVEAVLLRAPGVASAGVNFAADAAVVRWNPAKTSLRELQQAVRKLGYAARAADDAGADGRRDALRRNLQVRLAIAVVFGMWSMMAAVLLYLAPLGIVDTGMHWPLALASGLFALPVLAYSGVDFYIAGLRTLRARVPGMDTLITLAVFAATLVSVIRLSQGAADVYFDAAVMLITFQLVARIIDHRVRRDAASAIRGWLHAAPERVARIDDNGIETVPAADIAIDDFVRVLPGERVPMDGVIVNGTASLDQAMLTGERAPRVAVVGDAVFAGCTSLDGEIVIRVSAKAGKRRIDAMARSVRGLLGRKSALQKLTDRIARFLLPVVVLAALAAAALALSGGAAWQEAAARALAVLIVTCPCALSLAIPLAAVVAIERGAANGMIFRDPAVLESAARVKTVVFDKTGTLTTGEPAVDGVDAGRAFTRARVLQAAANATAGTPHPIARALSPFRTVADGSSHGERAVSPGGGVAWTQGKETVLAGNRRWLAAKGIDAPSVSEAGMCVHVAIDGRYGGCIRFRESLRGDALATLTALQDMRCETWLLSGDNPRACEPVAARLGIPLERVKAAQAPEDKRDLLETLQAGQPVLFVGDGMNDGLALATAKLGVAVAGADPTARAAAAVLLPDGPGSLPAMLALARGAWRTMQQNLAWALAYNAVALPLAVAGFVHPALAAVAMSLSTVCVLGNSLRFRWRASRNAKPHRKTFISCRPFNEETWT